MDSFVLETFPREASQKSKAIRASGKVPAEYYGRGQKNISFQMDYQKFKKIFLKAGENTIIELAVDGKKLPVLIHEMQYDPISDDISHVDFIHVDMDKEVTTSVKVTILGIAPAVKNLGGILDVQKHDIKIKCLPKNLIHSIEVDVSSIVDFHTSIHVKDLKVPSTIKILDNMEDTVVTATHIKVEEEKPAAAATAEGAAAAGAEGAAPAAGAPGAAPAAGAAGAPGAAPAAGAKAEKKK